MFALPPVIDRELRIRSRQALTYWGRCAVAALAVLVCMEEIETSAALTPTKAGAATFGAVSWLGFLLACGVTLATADCLSRERREGTLGLLLLTDLKGLHVVLGKLCVAGLTAAYVLVGFLPALGLLLLMGGVGLGEIARMAVALLNAAFVALAVGMWVSGRAQTRTGAVRGSVLLIFALCLMPRFLMYVWFRLIGAGEFISSVSPYTPFVLADDAAFSAERWLYWLSLGMGQVVGWGLLAWTALQLRYNLKTVDWKPPPKPVVWEPASETEAKELAAQRLELKENDPLCWAMSRMRIQNALIWGGSLLLLLSGTGFSWALVMVGPSAGAALGAVNGLHLLLSLGAATLLSWAAGRFFYGAQRNGELELLLSTPLGAADIVSANWRALCQPLRGAWLLVGFVILVEFVLLPSPSPGMAGGGAMGPLEKVLPVAMRVMDIIALCWMGMWFGLQARKPISVFAWPVGLVVGLPWLLSYVIMFWFAFNGAIRGRTSQPVVQDFWLLIWPALNIGKDIVMIGWATNKLRDDLRTTVSLGAGRVTE